MATAGFRIQAAKALQEESGTQVRISGWVASKSVVGGIVFLLIRDGSGYVQVAGKRGLIASEIFDSMRMVTKESAVSVGGEVRADKRAPDGKEISVRKFEIMAPADKWPITKSAVKSARFLYDNRYLSIRGRKATALMNIRAELIYASFEFFTQRGFHLISAPIFVQSACEGGATLFKIDYFGQTAYLSQSAQLYEEAAICAFDKVFIFQPAFRAEKSKTPKHLTEFWMIEAEQAFVDQEHNLKLQEEYVAYVAGKVVERRLRELNALGRIFKPPQPPFPQLTYEEVRSMAEKKGIAFDWGEDIPTEAERLVSMNFDKPVFITDYPLSARSFYHMTKSGDEQITLSDDIIAPEGHGEIATGGQRIHEYQALLERIKKQNLPVDTFRWYLDLRRFGMPIHSGFGLGIERTTKWISGLRHIRAASLFPRTINRVTP